MSTPIPYNVWVWDDGYGDNKCVTHDKFLVVPTNYTQWRKLERNDFVNSGNPLDYISVEFNGGKFLVGEVAMKQDPKSSWFGGANKHLDIGFPVFMNACFGTMASAPTENVDLLVMGLPVNSDSDEKRHQLLEDMVVREHNMRIGLGDGSEFSRVVNIERLIVKKQPFGSLCDIMLNDIGDIIDKKVAKGFNVIVDIGSRTCNVYTLENLEPIGELCFHTNDGMYTSYMNVNGYVEHKLGQSIPTGKLPLLMRSGHIKDIDLSPVIDKSYEILAYEIRKVLDTKFIHSYPMVDRIIFTGGGAELLKPHLSKLFSNKEIVFLDRFANARGLRKYGIRQIAKASTKTSVPVTRSHQQDGIVIRVGETANGYHQ